MIATRFDDKGNEVECNDPHMDCDSFQCDKCGNEMAFNYFGENSWFYEEPPYNAKFNYCPECGCKVVKKDCEDL